MTAEADLARLMQRGRAAQQQGQWAAAAEAFGAAAIRFPEDPGAAFAMCVALLQTSDRSAGSFVQRLLARFPAYAPGWEALGQALIEAGKADAALVCLRRAASIAPSASLALACGNALRSLGRLAEARAAFEEACRLAPHAPRAAFLLGLCAQDARDLPAAQTAYQRALALQPSLPEAWVNLGTVRQEMGDLEGAKQAYAAAIRQRPDTFGRISQALTAAPKGELWLDLARLRRSLSG